MAAEPVLHRLQAGGVEVRHRTDRVMAIRMRRREQPLGHRIIEQAIGAVVALALFVLDDAALLVEHALRDRTEQIAHAIALQEQRTVERAGRHRLEIIGAIEIGRAVEVGRADLLQRREEVARGVFRSVEHQMLEQMREAGRTLRLVLRPDVIPDAHRDDRRLAIGVDDHAQPVLQRELLIRDVHFLDQRRHRRGLHRRGRGLRNGGQRKRKRRGPGQRGKFDRRHAIPPRASRNGRERRRA